MNGYNCYLTVNTLVVLILTTGGSQMFNGIVRVFSTISGLVTVRSDGKIHSINGSFSVTLLGYDNAELVGQVLHMT